VDFRAALLELARERKLGLPRYSLVAEQGPVHMRVFTMEVRLGKGEAAQADGASKKAAAQEASRELYQRLAAAPPQPTEG
jgi:ribonuclease-3